MYETLLRPHQVDAAPRLTPIGAVADKLKASEARREEKRLRQIANARAGAERRAAKRKAEDMEDGNDNDKNGDASAGTGVDGKRAKTETEGGVPPEIQAQDEREAAAEAMETDGDGAAAAAAAANASGFSRISLICTER